SSGALRVAQAIEQMKVGQDQAQAARSARGGQGDDASSAAESAAKKLESLLNKTPNAKGAAGSGDLDGCFGLPKEGGEQGLNQLGQGRQLPSLGSEGQQGSGFSGSQTRMSIFGPHRVTAGESDSTRDRGSAQQGAGRGSAGPEREATRGAETLKPSTRQTSRSA